MIETLTHIYDVVVTNLPVIMAYVGASVTFASTVVKLTPTQKDDAVLAVVIDFLEKFSIFNKNVK